MGTNWTSRSTSDNGSNDFTMQSSTVELKYQFLRIDQLSSEEIDPTPANCKLIVYRERYVG